LGLGEFLKVFLVEIRRLLLLLGVRVLVLLLALLTQGAFYGMIGSSRAIRIMFDQLREIAALPRVLHRSRGESGTGKELVAKALHDLSPRCKAPFLAVNCSGIPADLLESEFFGHEEGAFTGAVKKRPGLFHRTRQGSLLLDEIGEMPYNLQSKLLRMLQDGSFRAVGANKEQQVDVRIICATNQDLESLMDSGQFRQDLFYRLETFSLTVPSLRERKDDIPLLAAHFLNRYCLHRRSRNAAHASGNRAAIYSRVLEKVGGNKRRAAAILGVSRRTLYRHPEG